MYSRTAVRAALQRRKLAVALLMAVLTVASAEVTDWGDSCYSGEAYFEVVSSGAARAGAVLQQQRQASPAAAALPAGLAVVRKTWDDCQPRSQQMYPLTAPMDFSEDL